jgi:propionyl-CoA carboxylase alpha chain
VRNDSGVVEGDAISMFYDPMIAKLCTWAPTRDEAIDGMAQALEGFHIEGVGHNLPFLSAVMDQARFREGRLTTGYIAEEFPEGFKGLAPTSWQRDVLTAVAAWAHGVHETRRRNGAGVHRADWIVSLDGADRRVNLARDGNTLRIGLPDEDRALGLDDVDWRPGKPLFRGALDGRAFTVHLAATRKGWALQHRAAKVSARVISPSVAALYGRLPKRAPADTSRTVVSPMPGLVVAVEVKPGEAVKEGQTLCIIEAMKMQNLIRAERDGTVKRVEARADDTVAADDVLVEFE